MKKVKALLLILGVLLMFTTSAYAVVDVIEYPSGFFTPNSTTSSPYYRWYNEDWGWHHNAIGGTFTTASLNISAWDVDAAQGEVDEISVWDEDTLQWIVVGTLAGNNNAWGYSTFNLGSQFFNEIATGLNVWMNIDKTHNYDNWAVLLAKSALSLDGGALPDPEPGAPIPGTTNPVPEPGTFMLLGSGLVGLLGYGKAKFGKKA